MRCIRAVNQRGYEREVRKVKREIATGQAYGQDMTAERARLGMLQRRLREHCAANSLRRDYARERAYGVAEQPRALGAGARVAGDRRKAIAWAGGRVYGDTAFTDTLAGIVGRDDARGILDDVYERLETCGVPGLAKLWGDTFHDVSLLAERKGGGAYYVPGAATAHFERPYLSTDAPNSYSTPLQTVFHEIGHAIDNRLGGGMTRQYRSMTDDGGLGRVIFSDWCAVAARKAKEVTAPLRERLAAARARSDWGGVAGGLAEDMLAAGVMSDVDMTHALRALDVLERWMGTLGDDERERAVASGVRVP